MLREAFPRLSKLIQRSTIVFVRTKLWPDPRMHRAAFATATQVARTWHSPRACARRSIRPARAAHASSVGWGHMLQDNGPWPQKGKKPKKGGGFDTSFATPMAFLPSHPTHASRGCPLSALRRSLSRELGHGIVSPLSGEPPRLRREKTKKATSNIGMDKIHFAPPDKSWFLSRFPCKYQQINKRYGFHVFFGGAKMDFVHPQ